MTVQTAIETTLAQIPGFLLGILATLITTKLTEKKKIYKIETQRSRIVNLDRAPGRDIVISVDKQLITGDATDAGTRVEIPNAVGHRIIVRNVGNEPILKPGLVIRFAERTIILNQEYWPENRSGHNVALVKNPLTPHVLEVTPDHINPKEEFTVGVTTTGPNSEQCNAELNAAGASEWKPNPFVSVAGHPVTTGVVALVAGLITAQITGNPGAFTTSSSTVMFGLIGVSLGIVASSYAVISSSRFR